MTNSPHADVDQTLKAIGALPVRVVDVKYVDVPESTMVPPLRYRGGDLGLCDRANPWIEFQDATGKQFLTHSVEWLLGHIDQFAPGRDQDQPLAAAAIHYGLNVYALMGREHAESEGRTWAAQRAAQRGEE